MYIAVFKNNGKDYLRLMESYRTKSANGKVSIRKRIIHKAGAWQGACQPVPLLSGRHESFYLYHERTSH